MSFIMPLCCTPLFPLSCWCFLLTTFASDPSVFLRSFSVHPLPNVGRAINNFDPSSDAGTQKPNCIDIHEVQVAQIQSHLPANALDLSAQIVELLISKFPAKPD